VRNTAVQLNAVAFTNLMVHLASKLLDNYAVK